MFLNYLNDGPKWQMFIFKITADYKLPAKYSVLGETEGIRSFVQWEWMNKKKYKWVKLLHIKEEHRMNVK